MNNPFQSPSWMLGIALLGLFACLEKQSAAPPNIILIMADDLGYGDLSCYGSTQIPSPHLDQLAAEGIRFTDYHSNGAVCSPTRAALLSGQYQQRVGIPGVVRTTLRDSLGMAQEVETVAEVLQQAGYATGIFGKWHLGYKREFNPIHQGFDQFKGFVAGNVDYHSHLDNMNVLDWWEQDSLRDEPGYTTDLITRYGLDFLRQNYQKPFFLYLPYAAPHDPYQGRKDPPIRVTNQENRKLAPEQIPPIYREMLEVLDEGVGQLIAQLKALQLSNNTLVIFCSDNGANQRGSNGILRGFKGGLYEGGHRVPAIAWWPGRIAAGQENASTVLSMDWFPTLLELAGIPPGNRSLDGKSIRSVLLSGGTIAPRPLFWQYNQQKAVREGNWKLVLKGTSTELFDLQNDLSESQNLRESHPDKLARLQQALAVWESSLVVPSTPQP